jgi:hypothetical protein
MIRKHEEFIKIEKIKNVLTHTWLHMIYINMNFAIGLFTKNSMH